jgi:hypothetical protein
LRRRRPAQTYSRDRPDETAPVHSLPTILSRLVG